MTNFTPCSKATGWIQTPSFNLSSLHEARTLLGELFIRIAKSDVLVNQNSSGWLMF